MGSHGVTCHPTQVNVPHFNPSQGIPEGWKAELTLVLVICHDGLPVHRQSPIQAVHNHLTVTQPGLRESNL